MSASTDHAPAPSTATVRKAQQNSAADSPPLTPGHSDFGVWTVKYAYAIEPEQRMAAGRVRKPIRTSPPATTWIRAAHQPGHSPNLTVAPAIPFAPPKMPNMDAEPWT